MIEINGKIYRNLQEQVYENKEQIEQIQEDMESKVEGPISSVGAVVVSVGNNQVATISGSNGKILGWSNGAVWQNPPEADVEGKDVKSTGETSGKVLTADGNGEASWESVPQNFTGSVSGVKVVVSVGDNQLSGLAGSGNQVLGWNGGPAFGKAGYNFALGYTTTAPTANNPDGLKIAILTAEPATRYSGWLYIILE